MATNDTYQPFSKHGTSYTSFILVFFLVSFGITISCALIALPSTAEFHRCRDFLITTAHSFSCFYAASLAILILWFISRYKHWVYKGLVALPIRRLSHLNVQLMLYEDNNGNEEPVNGGHSSWLQIVLFGIGSIAYLVSDLVKVASEITVDKVRVAKFVILFTCCLLSIGFMKLYNGVFLKNTRLFHYSISVMIAAVVCEWISVTMSPLWGYSAKNATLITNSTISLSSHAEGNFGLVLDMIQSFLQPFFVEFLSISATCLIDLWQTMRKEIHYQIVHEVDYSDTGFTLDNDQEDTSLTYESSGDPIDNHEATGDDQIFLTVETGSVSSHNSNDQRIKRYKLQTSIVVAISVCVTVLFVIACSKHITPVLRTYRDTPVVKWISDLYQPIVFAPLILLIIISLYKLNNSKIDIKKSKHFTSTDYLLLFTSSAVFVHNILQIFSLIGFFVTRSNVSTLEILYEILFWVISAIGHIWGQTQLLMTAQYIRRSQQKLPKFLRFTLIYLVSINLGLWMCDSIFHKWVENSYQDPKYELALRKMFGESNTKVILLTLLPLWDLYSFHSAIVAYNILNT